MLYQDIIYYIRTILTLVSTCHACIAFVTKIFTQKVVTNCANEMPPHVFLMLLKAFANITKTFVFSTYCLNVISPTLLSPNIMVYLSNSFFVLFSIKLKIHSFHSLCLLHSFVLHHETEAISLFFYIFSQKL